jgi:hypothetical protein
MFKGITLDTYKLNSNSKIGVRGLMLTFLGRVSTRIIYIV